MEWILLITVVVIAVIVAVYENLAVSEDMMAHTDLDGDSYYDEDDNGDNGHD